MPLTPNKQSAKLRTLTDQLLDDKSSWLEKRKALHCMHALFVSCGAISTTEPLKENNAIWLDHGYAVSPVSAAFCLLEIRRTELFVKGLVAAIRELLQELTEHPIHILDAGCGPYALLSLLAAQYFSEKEVQFHLLDIHEANKISAQKLIDAVELNDRLVSFTIADACHYQWPQAAPLHIVVCETMLNGLRKEPQVAVTLNLAPQLHKKGIWIPEMIDVDLVLVDVKKQNSLIQKQIASNNNESIDHGLYEKKLSTIISVSAKSTKEEILKKPLTMVQLPPEFVSGYHYLRFHTFIKVYKEYVLERNDTSLTLPLTISQPNKNSFPANANISFRYNMEGMPGICYELY